MTTTNGKRIILLTGLFVTTGLAAIAAFAPPPALPILGPVSITLAAFVIGLLIGAGMASLTEEDLAP